MGAELLRPLGLRLFVSLSCVDGAMGSAGDRDFSLNIWQRCHKANQLRIFPTSFVSWRESNSPVGRAPLMAQKASNGGVSGRRHYKLKCDMPLSEPIAEAHD